MAMTLRDMSGTSGVVAVALTIIGASVAIGAVLSHHEHRSDVAIAKLESDLAGAVAKLEERVAGAAGKLESDLPGTAGKLEERMAGVAKEVDAKLAGFERALRK